MLTERSAIQFFKSTNSIILILKIHFFNHVMNVQYETTDTWNFSNFEMCGICPVVLLSLSARIPNNLIFLYFTCFPCYNTEIEERSIHSNNGKIFQSHKLYFWQFPFKRPFNSKATTIRNGGLSQRCYSRAEDKSAGRTRIWSHYTSECVNAYETDALILFMHTFKGMIRVEAWRVTVFMLGHCGVRSPTIFSQEKIIVSYM